MRAALERPVGAASLEHPPEAADLPTPSAAAIVLAPNVLAVEHWNRLVGGLLYAATPRLDWVTLLRRTFEVDVLACNQCGGRLRVLAAVTDAAMVRVMLESLSADAVIDPGEFHFSTEAAERMTIVHGEVFVRGAGGVRVRVSVSAGRPRALDAFLGLLSCCGI